ncbi:MAG TPA: nickel-dependent hydrogenase large subunit [Methanomicrobiales archaeon]|nr:nickel-dependent hydrogenase large subunit [Methanomicrobiales archaeon]
MVEITVPVGPQHPALKEPVNFKVVADGETIVRLELDVSYNHRGIEKAAEQRDFNKTIPLLERVCGICSHSHGTNFAKGIEEIMGVSAPPRAQYIRTIVAELERMHSHLLWLGVAAHEIGFNTLFMWTWKDREVVQDILEELTGNRVNYGVNIIGGVRRDLSPSQVARTLTFLPQLENRLRKYLEMVKRQETLLLRFRGVGTMTRAQAISYGAVGPTARASGVEYDVRQDDPYIAYGEIPWKVVTATEGDVYARTVVRIGELVESLGMIRYCLEHLPAGPVTVDVPKKAPAGGEILSRYEAPRGELCHYIRTNGTDRVDRIDIRTPTLANWTSVAVTLVGQNIADIPVIVAAIDPCLSCTSRMAVVDREGRARPRLSCTSRITVVKDTGGEA